ncbi:hypothetical protein BKA70DRAFT_175077 [Coprinopsis sp. MPI-PUGE-AT-0042]|nr:hypothetical protein BKA70DRAFT_175077 [Coprinopsis sp. MPI-PUGE-AT-0042]
MHGPVFAYACSHTMYHQGIMNSFAHLSICLAYKGPNPSSSHLYLSGGDTSMNGVKNLSISGPIPIPVPSSPFWLKEQRSWRRGYCTLQRNIPTLSIGPINTICQPISRLWFPNRYQSTGKGMGALVCPCGRIVPVLLKDSRTTFNLIYQSCHIEKMQARQVHPLIFAPSAVNSAFLLNPIPQHCKHISTGLRNPPAPSLSFPR